MASHFGVVAGNKISSLAIFGGVISSMGLMGFGLLCALIALSTVRAGELFHQALLPLASK